MKLLGGGNEKESITTSVILEEATSAPDGGVSLHHLLVDSGLFSVKEINNLLSVCMYWNEIWVQIHQGPEATPS